jgi:hypothetical protein
MQLTGVMVRAFKGAAASIILLFLAEQRALSQAEMRRYTAYADEAISDALGLLRESGLVVETGRYTWALLEGGMRQLPLGAVDKPFEEGRPVDKPVDNYVDNFQGAELGPDDPELALNESMNQSMNPINEDDSLIDASSGNSGAAADEVPTAAALKALGFYGRGITDMLAITGLTMREVRFHAEDAPNLGAALARIKRRQPAPANWGRDGPNERRKYIDGAYADIIKH